MDSNSSLDRQVPATVSGIRENVQRTDRTRPYLGRSAPERASLTVFEETPRIQLDGVTSYVRPGSVMGLVYFNPPRIDSHVWRALARKVRAHIREFDINSPGRSFFSAYPELRLDAHPSYQLDNDIQTEALVHDLRKYYELVTYAVCAMANSRIMSTVGSDGPYARYSAPLRWSKFNAEHRYLNGFPIASNILNYITEATRPLSDIDVNGIPVGVFPQWRVDDAGWTSQATAGPFVMDNQNNARAVYANARYQDDLVANPNAKGIRPNTQGFYHSVAAGQSTLPIILPDPTAFNVNDGYIPSVLQSTSRYYVDLLKSPAYARYKMKGSPLNEFWTKIIPILDGVIDIESLDRAIRDNQPGSVSDFAEHYLTFGIRLTATLNANVRAKTFDLTTNENPHRGAYLSSNDDYATLLRGVEAGSDFSKYEPYYAARIVQDHTGASLDEEAYAIGDANARDVVTIDVLPEVARLPALGARPHLTPFNASSRLAVLLGDTDNVYPPASVDFVGLSADDVVTMLSVGAIGDKPFIIREEAEGGVHVIRSMVTPLIDRWDPTQCGFYIVIANDGSFINHWRDYINTAEEVATAASAKHNTDCPFNVATSSIKDGIYYVGDGLLLGPEYMQARPNVTVPLQVVMRDGGTGGTSLAVISPATPEGLWLTKPYTLPPPNGLQLYDPYDPDVTSPHVLLTTGGGDVDFGHISGTSTVRSNIHAQMTWLWPWKGLLSRLSDTDIQRRLMPFSLLPTVRAVNVLESLAVAGEGISTLTDFSVIVPQLSFGAGSLERDEAGMVITLAKPKFIQGLKYAGGNGKPSRGSGKANSMKSDQSRFRASPSRAQFGKRGTKVNSGIKTEDARLTQSLMAQAHNNVGTMEVLGTPSEDNPFSKVGAPDNNSRNSASSSFSNANPKKGKVK